MKLDILNKDLRNYCINLYKELYDNSVKFNIDYVLNIKY